LHQRIEKFLSTKHTPIYSHRRLDLELATALGIWTNPMLDDSNYLKQGAYNSMMQILNLAEEMA